MGILSESFPDFFKTNNEFHLINIVGDIGIGKTSNLKNELNNLGKTIKVIDCLIYSALPYSCLYSIFANEPMISPEKIYIEINKLLDLDYLLIFDHFDNIDPDSSCLLKQVIEYRKKINKTGTIILESKQTIEYFGNCNVVKCKCEKKEIITYITNEMQIKHSYAKSIAEKCSYNYYDICIFCQIYKSVYNQFGKRLFDDELLNVYTDYLNKYCNMFTKFIYVFNNIKMPIFYDILDIAFPSTEQKDIFKLIIQKGILFTKINLPYNKYLGLSESYNYSSNSMKFAIKNYIETNYVYTNDLFNNGVENLKNFISNTNKNENFDKLNIYKKILILQTIIDSEKCNKNELIDYYNALIELYKELSASSFIINTNKQIIAKTNRNFRQLADINERYQMTILNAYYTLGKYEEICNEICFNNVKNIKNDENRIIYAKIHYVNGHPEIAKNILTKDVKLKDANYYNLLASIYDWYGDDHNYKKCINLARKKADQIDNKDAAEYIKHLVNKNIHSIDLPEKEILLQNAIKYFEKKDKHIYAESLFNYGTLLILNNAFNEGIKYIDKAIQIFNLCYSHKTIYCKLSYGISLAMQQKYFEAISMWEEIKDKFTDEFTNYAVSLNILMAKMKLNINIDNELDIIKDKMLNDKNNSKTDNDLLKLSTKCSFKLQIRFYFLLRALSELNKNNDKISKKVIYYAKLAIKSYKSPSSNEYLLYFLSGNNRFENGKNKIKLDILNNKCYFCNSMLWE